MIIPSAGLALEASSPTAPTQRLRFQLCTYSAELQD